MYFVVKTQYGTYGYELILYYTTNSGALAEQGYYRTRRTAGLQFRDTLNTLHNAQLHLTISGTYPLQLYQYIV